MKKIFLISALSGLLLAACGDTSNSEVPAESTSNKEVVESENEASEKVSEGKLAVEDYYEEDIPLLTEDVLTLNETSYNFIKANPDIFPATDENAVAKVKSMIDSSIEYKHLDKNVAPYLEKIISVTGTVVEIEEVPMDGFTLTVIHILDDNFNSYQSLLYDSAQDVFQEDVITLIGLPLGPSSFENVSGGTTNVQVLAASVIEK